MQHLEALARAADERGDPLIPCASNVQEDWGLRKLFTGGYSPAQLSHQPASGTGLPAAETPACLLRSTCPWACLPARCMCVHCILVMGNYWACLHCAANANRC